MVFRHAPNPSEGRATTRSFLGNQHFQSLFVTTKDDMLSKHPLVAPLVTITFWIL